MKTASSNIRGAISLVLAMFIFSLQDIAVKWISGDYSVLEIVVFRSLIALPCTFFFLHYEGRRGLPTTGQPRLEYIRGFFLFLSFTTYMMALPALPLADVAAIRNSGPLMITFLSVVWLGEKVGPRRWLALLAKFRMPIRALLFCFAPGLCQLYWIGSSCLGWGWFGPAGCIS
jgi:drug/metabolite transporter (DMT)-like permease